MKKRTGRPPKQVVSGHSLTTLRFPADTKNLIIEQADAYDMSLTEYLTMLVERDASQT